MSDNFEKVYELHKGLFGETDRNSGEYHFRSGSTEQIYSNAHYAPLGEDPVPPKYYKPSAVSGAARVNRRVRGFGFLAVLVLCLACAVLGGVIGAGLMSSYFKDGTAESIPMESPLQFIAVPASSESSVNRQISSQLEYSPSEIYDLAFSQVVSVRTEFSYTTSGGEVLPANIDGSGFVVDDKGYILTNYHVVEKAYSAGYPVLVTLGNGDIYDGNVIGIDEINDLAILKVEASGLSAVSFGNDQDIRGGENIYIMGNPYGMLGHTMNSGYISNPTANVMVDDLGNPMDMFQMDISVYEGNSGGPVYNSKGNVIGIVTARVDVNSSEGIGFALPVSKIIPIYETLVGKGLISGIPSLGVRIFEDYNPTYISYWKLPAGAFVDSVLPGSCAERAGLQPGDVISQISDIAITEPADIPYAMERFHAYDTVEIVFYREGNPLSTTVTLDEQKAAR